MSKVLIVWLKSVVYEPAQSRIPVWIPERCTAGAHVKKKGGAKKTRLSSGVLAFAVINNAITVKSNRIVQPLSPLIDY
jgi:hypothetical protein